MQGEDVHRQTRGESKDKQRMGGQRFPKKMLCWKRPRAVHALIPGHIGFLCGAALRPVLYKDLVELLTADNSGHTAKFFICVYQHWQN